MIACAAGAVAVAAAEAVLTGGSLSSPAEAACAGAGCMPGSGYTLDKNWNCGVLASGGADRCYYNATRSESSATAHSFGWASGDYDGAGHTTVGVELSSGGTSIVGGWGTDLMRVCYYTNCNDQSVQNVKVSVFQEDSNGAGHTIYGHAKA